MERIKRIFSNMEDSIDAFLISTSEHPNTDLNFFYVTGIHSGSFEHSTALVKRNGEKILFTSELEAPIAKAETDFKIVTERDQLKKHLSGIKKLGINYNSITFSKIKKLEGMTSAKLIDISQSLSTVRSIKDKMEIENITKACKISSRVADKIPSMIRPNISEKELAGEITSLMLKESNNTSFPTIVAFGKNASRPHHSPTDTRLKKNEFVLTDFGAEFNKYASDISRTFVLGRADKKMIEIYETVLKVQLESIDMVKDGINGKDVDAHARKMIDKRFKGTFIHSLGHEVGLSVHDGNRLSSQADFILKENMIVTIEPGIYIPSIGGVRIEDTVLVTKGKPEILTNVKKNLMEL